MATYSFQDWGFTISGPGGNIPLGSGAGAASEGIVIKPQGKKNTMTIGAGGDVMHALRAGDPAEVEINLLKTSKVNAQLMNMFKSQTQSSANWGQNTITGVNATTGENITVSMCAFQNVPELDYSESPKNLKWTFDGGKIVATLGTYAGA